jgi:hypothetical protein
MSIALLNVAASMALASIPTLTSFTGFQVPGGFGGIESLSSNNNIANSFDNLETAAQLTCQTILAKSQARYTGKPGEEVINAERIRTLEEASKLACQRAGNTYFTFSDYVVNTYAPAIGVGALALASAACPPLAPLLLPVAGLAAAIGIKQQFLASMTNRLVKDVESNAGTLSNNSKNAYFWTRLEQVFIAEGKVNGLESAALWLQATHTKEVQESLGKSLKFGDLVTSFSGAVKDATEIATSGFKGALA